MTDDYYHPPTYRERWARWRANHPWLTAISIGSLCGVGLLLCLSVATLLLLKGPASTPETDDTGQLARVAYPTWDTATITAHITAGLVVTDLTLVTSQPVLSPTDTATPAPAPTDTTTPTPIPTVTATPTPTPAPERWVVTLRSQRIYQGPLADWTDMVVEVDHRGPAIPVTLRVSGFPSGYRYWRGDWEDGAWTGTAETITVGGRWLWTLPGLEPAGVVTVSLEGPMPTVLTLTLPPPAGGDQTTWTGEPTGP